jgi:ubiquinone/menaquinone biosynthesis C-methylase UbiE
MPTVTLLVGDATKLPLQDGSFDAAVISLALHDMPHAAREQVLAEAKRILTPGGRIILADYSRKGNSWFAQLSHVVAKTWESRYYEDFLRRGLEPYIDAAGLTVRRAVSFMSGSFAVLECSVAPGKGSDIL